MSVVELLYSKFVWFNWENVSCITMCTFIWFKLFVAVYMRQNKVMINILPCMLEQAVGHLTIIENILKLCMNNKRDGCQIKYFSLFCRPVKLSDFRAHFETLSQNTNLLFLQAYQVLKGPSDL
jgi:hypothetical protein